MNLVKTGRWIFVDITLLYVPPVYYVYYGQLCWIKLSESESEFKSQYNSPSWLYLVLPMYYMVPFCVSCAWWKV